MVSFLQFYSLIFRYFKIKIVFYPPDFEFEHPHELKALLNNPGGMYNMSTSLPSLSALSSLLWINIQSVQPKLAPEVVQIHFSRPVSADPGIGASFVISDFFISV